MTVLKGGIWSGNRSILNPVATGPFTPLSLSPELWLRGDSCTLGTAPAVAIATDLSANARVVNQAVVGSRPTQVTGVINGQSVFRFLTSSTQFFNATYAFNHTNTTVWSVCSVTDTGGGKCLIGSDTVTTGLKCSFNGSEQNSWRKGISLIANTTSSVTVAAFKVQEAYYNSSTGAYEFLSSNTTNGSGTSGVTGTVGSGNSYIGRAEATNIDYMEGDIAELIVISRQLTGTERSNLYTYAVARYGAGV